MSVVSYGLLSVCPGVVEPHMEIDCEINWHPGFNSPTEGDFDLFVQEGIPQRLHCVAKVCLANINYFFLFFFSWAPI